jgi:hypothetical protein
LCAHDTLAGGEMDIRRRTRPQPQRALERENVGRVRHDFGAPQRREDAMLTGESDDRAGSHRRDRREFDRLEALGGRHQVTVDGQHRAQVDRCRHAERVAAVLRHEFLRAARQGSRLHHFKQKRLELRA